jgi:hypothetical protein
MSEENQRIYDIPYESISDILEQDKKQLFDNQKEPLNFNEFVKTAGLEGVVAKVSIPPNGNLSITEIKIGDKKIYPLTQGGSKPTKRGGGRKSRVSTRRGGGRKSRRRHNYI